MIELCWFSAHLALVYLVLKTLKIYGISNPLTKFNKNIFYLIFGFANGPLGATVVLFQLPLVLNNP